MPVIGSGNVDDHAVDVFPNSAGLDTVRAWVAVDEGRMRGDGIVRKLQRLTVALAFAGAGIAALLSSACAQQLTDPADDLRPLALNSQDVLDGRDLAAASCAACHGADGISAKEGVPHLAGQRPSYLYRKLKTYRRGDRSGGGDGHNLRLMKFLTDEALS
ncbi:MAG: c-type cytochrome, partial [Hyphomicrobiales bacterium]|nr:c-type cytochrome [Hyphomicrobiales bacterium]